MGTPGPPYSQGPPAKKLSALKDCPPKFERGAELRLVAQHTAIEFGENTPVFHLEGGQWHYLDLANRRQAERIYQAEPNSVWFWRGRPSSLHILNVDTWLLRNCRPFAPEHRDYDHLYRERLGGDDWVDVHGHHFHVAAGYRVFVHRRPQMPPRIDTNKRPALPPVEISNRKLKPAAAPGRQDLAA